MKWSREIAEKHYKKYIEKAWKDKDSLVSKKYKNKEEALSELMENWEFGQPVPIIIKK